MLIVKEKDHNAVGIACEFLRAGKIISFATDTIYGIAVDANNYKAVESLYKIKNRDEKKPIAIFVKDLNAAEKIFYFDETAKKIAKKFMPGALTLVLKTKPEAFSNLASNLNRNIDNFLGFRVANSFFVKKIFENFDGNLAVSSANLSDQKNAISATEIAKTLPNIDLIIDGGTCDNKASTVAKIFNNKISILRQGPINLD